MKQDLRHFLHPSPLPSRWLLIESSEYIPHLLARCPAARITSVESDADIAALPRFAGFDVDWVTADFRTEDLPVGRGAFDFVLTAAVLTESCRPYETLLGLATVLTDTGTLLASFRNLRYSGVLEALRQGEFPLAPTTMNRHYYTKAQLVRLLYHTMFREIIFAPGEQDGLGTGQAGDEPLSASEQQWLERGFDDFAHDLATSVWLVEARRSTSAVANLKSLYTPEVRRQLARLLHRIEYDVSEGEAVQQLIALCQREGIFPEYLDDFIGEACHHADRVRGILCR